VRIPPPATNERIYKWLKTGKATSLIVITECELAAPFFFVNYVKRIYFAVKNIMMEVTTGERM